MFRYDLRQAEKPRTNSQLGVLRRVQGDLNVDARSFQPEADDPARDREIFGFSHRENVGALQRLERCTNSFRIRGADKQNLALVCLLSVP